MSNNDDYKAFGLGFIIDRLDSMKEDLHKIDIRSELTLEKLENHFREDSINLENITKSLESVQHQLDIYNKELSVHIAGVNELRRNNDLLQSRIEIEKQEFERRLQVVEEPIKWFSITKKYAIWISTVAAASTVILTILKYFNIF